MRWLIYGLLTVCLSALIVGRAQAEIELIPSRYVCSKAGNGSEIGVNFHLNPRDAEEFLDRESVYSLLDKAKTDFLNYCHYERLPSDMWLQTRDLGGFIAVLHTNGFYWEIVENKIAISEEQYNAAAKKRRDRFIADNSVQELTDIDRLSTNPFPYKDKIVALKASFIRMLSASEASFDGLVVSGLSPTQFTEPGVPSVLAIKVDGLTTRKTARGGEETVPTGTYAGLYICVQENCSDFYGK